MEKPRLLPVVMLMGMSADVVTRAQEAAALLPARILTMEPEMASVAAISLTEGERPVLLLVDGARTVGRLQKLAEALRARLHTPDLPVVAVFERVLPEAVPDIRAAAVRRILMLDELLSDLGTILRAAC